MALIVLSIAFDRVGAGRPGAITLADAMRRNPVVSALAERPGSSAHQLAEATSRPFDVVADDLHTLRELGLADRDASGRWSLTDEGVRLSPGPPASRVSGPGDVTPSP